MLETEILMRPPVDKSDSQTKQTKAKFYGQLKQPAIRAFCQLFLKCTDTNYHKNICIVLINCLKYKSNRNKFTINEITSAIKELFLNDFTGSVASCNISVSICDFMRKNKFNLPVDIFNCFLLLNIKEINKNKKQQIYEEKQQIKQRMKMAGFKMSKTDKERLKTLKRGGKEHFSKADRKKRKEQEVIDQTMNEMDSQFKEKDKLKNHTTIIENIFSIYWRGFGVIAILNKLWIHIFWAKIF